MSVLEYSDELIDFVASYGDTSDVTKVEVINANAVQLREVPHDISLCTNLRHIDLSENDISVIPNFSGLMFLNVIDLTDNDIHKMENFGDLPEITRIELSNNFISKIESIDHLDTLRTIDLSDNDIEKIENIGKVETLIIVNNNIKTIENIENVKHINFNTNPIYNILCDFEDMEINLLYSGIFTHNEVDKIISFTDPEYLSFKYNLRLPATSFYNDFVFETKRKAVIDATSDKDKYKASMLLKTYMKKFDEYNKEQPDTDIYMKDIVD